MRRTATAQDQIKLMKKEIWLVQERQEKPTHSGTKAADLLGKFLAGKHNVTLVNILALLQLLYSALL